MPGMSRPAGGYGNPYQTGARPLGGQQGGGSGWGGYKPPGGYTNVTGTGYGGFGGGGFGGGGVIGGYPGNQQQGGGVIGGGQQQGGFGGGLPGGLGMYGGAFGGGQQPQPMGQTQGTQPQQQQQGNGWMAPSNTLLQYLQGQYGDISGFKF